MLSTWRALQTAPFGCWEIDPIPSGAGYALENALSWRGPFPSCIAMRPLRRLAGFLEAERATLAGMALHNQEQRMWPC